MIEAVRLTMLKVIVYKYEIEESERCDMSNFINNKVINGAGTITAGEYQSIKIRGSARVCGEVKFEKMSVFGACDTQAKLNGDLLKISGTMKSDASIDVKYMYVLGTLSSKYSKIYANHLHVSGVLTNRDEVNASEIIVDGAINVNELYGDSIKIRTHFRGFFSISANFNRVRCKAKTIACTQIIAQNLECEQLEANEIHLERNCIINRIHCDGTLTFDSSCKIGNITGNCTIN